MDIETIYRLYFRDVCLFLQGLTRSETLAEELTQETFFRALDGLKDYDGKQDVRAWLFTVARNAYYDHCRRAKHAAPLEDAETKAADTPDIAQNISPSRPSRNPCLYKYSFRNSHAGRSVRSRARKRAPARWRSRASSDV